MFGGDPGLLALAHMRLSGGLEGPEDDCDDAQQRERERVDRKRFGAAATGSAFLGGKCAEPTLSIGLPRRA